MPAPTALLSLSAGHGQKKGRAGTGNAGAGKQETFWVVSELPGNPNETIWIGMVTN